ncbi:MAG: DUF3047 domain-containing protein [Rubritepida sp.]|jgi:hypothetical protein|nr:DUF3047 domain-containing protein [Rubritepida sp.]MCU0944133.1 DUF3047 domain-containing protein [Rubritepida sp.]
MDRRAMLALATTALPAPALARAVVQPDPGLVAAGWTHEGYDGLRPARFTAVPDGVAVEGEGAGSFVWRRVEGRAACLTWRWRVDLGPPPTDLTRRGGDDRAVSVSVGFAGWPARATLWQRTQHSVAQTQSGRHSLPRSVLIYAWGGTGREPAHFYSPWMGGLGKVRVLRAATTPKGRWFEERVDLYADWRAAFGGDPPPLQEVAISTDTDDTNARIVARVETIRFTTCV